MWYNTSNGEVTEWTMVAVLKTAVAAMSPWVRIPPSPPRRIMATEVPPMIKDLAKALTAHPKAQAAWDKLPPSHKREWLLHLHSIKKPETLQRNIEKLIASL
jgi:hypothetical protein